MEHLKINIDYEKCTTPFACKKCLQICPQAVFLVFPVKQEKFKETDENEPGSFLLKVFYGDRCSVCNQCTDVCPVDAINISYS